MSDSDVELTNNVFTFRNDNMVVTARGPGSVASNSGFRFRSKATSSTMHMAREFEQQRYERSFYMQQNRYRGRETSPMSACDMRQRHFNNSFYPIYGRGMSSQRSMYSGRGGSPMSVRSVNTTSSVVSAMDIAMALKTEKFNNNDLRLITKAYIKLMKREGKRRIEKRKNIRQFMKGNKYQSDDSGENSSTSNSSISSDDTSTNYKENMSSCRSTKTDISHLKETMRGSNIYRDSSQNFQQNRLRGIIPLNFNNTQTSVQPYNSTLTISQSQSMISNTSMATLKERFRNNNNGRLLPSQRFNRSVASSVIPEGTETGICEPIFNRKAVNSQVHDKDDRDMTETDSEQDDIFSASTKNKQNKNSRDPRLKRNIDSVDDISLPSSKKPKTASPCKNSAEFKKNKQKLTTSTDDIQNDFIFAKPAMPVWKSCSLKNKEKLISKSAPSLSNSLVQKSVLPASEAEKPIEHSEHEDKDPDTEQTSTDLSMRPSFIKRKLFSQKLDVADMVNVSNENLAANSPGTSIYSEIQKERNKARKLQQVATQSCLSRDLLQDESNLLDLIHKIVPPDQMNLTKRTNKTDLQNSKNKTEDNWDLDSVLSARKNDDESDTYTDEEAFNMTVKETIKENMPKEAPTLPQKQQCSKIIEKPPAHSQLAPKCKPFSENKGVINTSVQKSIKSFWDTDFESDAECHPPQPKNNPLNEVLRKDVIKKNEASCIQGLVPSFNSRKISSISNISMYSTNSYDSNVQKFNNSTLKIRSHRVPKRKGLNETKDDHVMSTSLEPRTKKQKTIQINSQSEQTKFSFNPEKEMETKVTKHRQEASKNKTNTKNTSITEKKLPKKNENSKKFKNEKKPAKITQNENSNTKKEIECVLKKKTSTMKEKSKKIKDDLKLTKTIKDETAQKQNQNKPNKKSPLREPKNQKQKVTNKKADDSKKINKYSPKAKKENKAVQHNTSFNLDTSTEENNNTSQRPVRSCRSKSNISQDKTSSMLNGTLDRTLRSRNNDLSSAAAPEIYKTKNGQKIQLKMPTVRLSDISFTLTGIKNGIGKKPVSKRLNHLKCGDTDISDLSFSLKDSPATRKTLFPNTRLNSKTGRNNAIKNSTFINNKSIQSKECKPTRKKTPNKRYL